MSTRISVKNMTKDWHLGYNHKVKVTTQEKDHEGNWKESTFEILGVQEAFEDLWAHSKRRFIIEET